VAGFFVFAAAFVAYAVTASPSLGWLDSPELAAASASLGVPHSPGHAPAVLLGRLAGLIPVGDLAFRASLASALAGAAAALLAYAIARRLVRITAPELGAHAAAFAAAGAALIFALSWPLWNQAVRAEVYALEALLCAAVLYAAIAVLDRGGVRALCAAGLAAGLSLSNHHFIAALVIAPAALAVLVGHHIPRPRLRPVAIAATLGILGLAAFLYLPVRAATHPEVNWGAPATAERFAWTVSAKAFHKSLGAEHVSTPGQDLAEIAVELFDFATPLVPLLALVGLALGGRSGRRAIALLGAVVVTSIAGRVAIGFDPGTPDHLGYLAPAVLALALLALVGTVRLLALMHRRGLPARMVELVAAAMMLSLAATTAARAGPQAAEGHARATDALVRWEFESLPPRALLLPAYFQTSFRLWGARTMWGSRPDVAILDRSFLTYPGAAAEARRRYPALTALIDAPLRAGSPTPVAALRELARTRPVLVQLHPNLDPEVRPWLVPAGPFAILVADPPTEALRTAAEAADARARAELAVLLGDDPAALDTLLWHDFVRLEQYCATGRRDAAAEALTTASALAPGDRMLADLAGACGLAEVAP
jgi:hypothetical protein